MKREANSGKTENLRKRAEKKAEANEAKTPETLSHEETHALFHELRVHQVELEMQNEELRRAREELEISRARYFDLYDLAPIGYLTISEKGLILEANLTAAILLGVEKNELIKMPLSRFIRSEDQDTYYQHRNQLIETQMPQECDLRMMKKDEALFWAHMTDTILDHGDKGSVSKVMLSDITDRKKLELEREKLVSELQQAISEIKTLKGIIPICASCKKIRNDKGCWDAAEKYLAEHSEVQFTHGMCDDCLKKHYPELYDKIHEKMDKTNNINKSC